MRNTKRITIAWVSLVFNLARVIRTYRWLHLARSLRSSDVLTIHMLGHVYITQGDKTMPVSAKALALIVYLHIEKLPQHRERLADLLWNTPLSRKNLRVELARIRSTGLNIFPSSHQLLELKNATSDIESWGAQFSQSMNQSQLTAALAKLRGTPLTGLEDLGSSTFQTWVDQQRWLMLQQIEHHLSRAYWRYAREHQTWATRLIAERAEALGLDSPAQTPPEGPPAGVGLVSAALAGTPSGDPAPAHRIRPIHFERQAEESLMHQVFCRAAEHPQLIALHGPAGSGKSYLCDRLAQQFGWDMIRVPSLRSGRFVLASLAQALIRFAEPQDAQALEHVLLQPASLDEDAVKVAFALSRVATPLVLLFEQSQDAPSELTSLLEYLFQAPGAAQRIFLLMGRSRAAHVPLVRALLYRTERSHSLELGLSRISNASVQQVLEAQFPFEPKQRLRVQAARLLQRSEGNPLYLLSLIDQAPDFSALYAMQLPQSLQDSYDSEVDACPEGVQQALKRLSVVYGRFDLEIASAVLWDHAPAQVEALLNQAVSRRLLIEADPELAIRWADGAAEVPRTPVKTEYIFRSEGLRMTITRPLSMSVRQETRRRLMLAYAQSLPGHAAYYAQRAHLHEEAERLQQCYRQQLPPDQVVTQRSGLPALSTASGGGPNDGSADYETYLSGSPDPLLSRQGYSVYRNQAELSVLSSNRYGLPSTLRIRFAPPPASGSPTLLLRWRLDLYRGGTELGPARLPFALRLSAVGSGQAHVLAPDRAGRYTEDGVEHQVLEECVVGDWMDDRLTLTPEELAAGVLELSIRAVDVALTIKELVWCGHSLLSGQPATPPHPVIQQTAAERSSLS
jgi:AAA ATPase domain